MQNFIATWLLSSFSVSVACGDPGVSDHVSIDQTLHINRELQETSQNITNTSWSYNDKIAYNCDYGYSQISGDMERRCEANGEWSGEVPICTGTYL